MTKTFGPWIEFRGESWSGKTLNILSVLECSHTSSHPCQKNHTESDATLHREGDVWGQCSFFFGIGGKNE